MAIQKVVRLIVWARADGESTVFEFNLNTSPYWLAANSPSGLGGIVVNWVGGASPGSQLPPPTGVVVVSGATSALIASPIVTVEVPVKSVGTLYNVVLDMLFD